MLRLTFGVAAMGGLGSLCRWALAAVVQRRASSGFPIGTLVVNVLGSLAIGVVMGAFGARGAMASPVRVTLTVGFLGGFTTASSFAFETFSLIEQRAFAAAAFNVAATVLVCIAACAAGAWLGRALVR